MNNQISIETKEAASIGKKLSALAFCLVIFPLVTTLYSVLSNTDPEYYYFLLIVIAIVIETKAKRLKRRLSDEIEEINSKSIIGLTRQDLKPSMLNLVYSEGHTFVYHKLRPGRYFFKCKGRFSKEEAINLFDGQIQK